MPTDDVPAERLRAALRDRKVSQAEAAAVMGLDASKLSKALHGRRRLTVEELRRASEHLHVDLDWLSGRGDDRPPVIAPSGLTALAPELYEGEDGERRLAAVEAAWVLVADHGHARVELEDVAVRCGLETDLVLELFPGGRSTLLRETLRLAARRAYERQRGALSGIDDGVRRLRTLIDLQLPSPGTLDREWSIWLQVWAEAAVDPTVREIHEQAYARWLATVRQAIALGQEQGACRGGDAEEMAVRLTALVDGLGLGLVTRRTGRTDSTVRDAVEDHLRAHVLVPETSEEDS